MTERKPPGVSWETWIDRQIREGMERGDFEGLPGHGKPIADLDRPRDEMWWVRSKLRREDVSVLPPTLELRKAVDAAKVAIAEAGDEATVRRLVDEINERIRRVNRLAAAGPPTTLSPFDVDEVVDNWRAAQARRPDPPA
jgi:hypothetical protein